MFVVLFILISLFSVVASQSKENITKTFFNFSCREGKCLIQEQKSKMCQKGRTPALAWSNGREETFQQMFETDDIPPVEEAW